MSLPKSMREPRKARGGWWYINRKGITVLAYSWPAAATTEVKLTRKQLERALQIMDEAK